MLYWVYSWDRLRRKRSQPVSRFLIHQYQIGFAVDSSLWLATMTFRFFHLLCSNHASSGQQWNWRVCYGPWNFAPLRLCYQSPCLILWLSWRSSLWSRMVYASFWWSRLATSTTCWWTPCQQSQSRAFPNDLLVLEVFFAYICACIPERTQQSSHTPWLSQRRNRGSLWMQIHPSSPYSKSWQILWNLHRLLLPALTVWFKSFSYSDSEVNPYCLELSVPILVF